MEKSLSNTNLEDNKKTTQDVKVFGNVDIFQLICKASSESQGWMKSCKAMQIEGGGCVVQVTTQYNNPDGTKSVAEALTFVPNVRIVEDETGRFLTNY